MKSEINQKEIFFQGMQLVLGTCILHNYCRSMSGSSQSMHFFGGRLSVPLCMPEGENYSLKWPCQFLRWLPTVLTVCTPEKGWRTKNELFVSVLGLSSWHSQWRLATHLDFFFIHMSILQTVAMATNNPKDNHFFAIFHLFASFSRVSLGKISWNSAVLWKRFRTIL